MTQWLGPVTQGAVVSLPSGMETAIIGKILSIIGSALFIISVALHGNASSSVNQVRVTKGYRHQ